MLSNLREMLDDPKKKRLVMVAGVAVVFVGILFFFTGSDTSAPRSNAHQETVRHILTVQSSRDMSLDSLAADVRLVARGNETLTRELERVRAELARKNNAGDGEIDTANLQMQLSELRTGLEKLNAENRLLRQSQQTQAPPPPISPPPAASVSSNPFIDEGDTGDVWAQTPPRPPANGANNAPAPDTRRIVITSGVVPEEEAELDEDAPVFIPAGSIVTGVFINGLDAPTNQGARRDPFPSALRVQKEAILPNRFSADVRECFMLVSGYGDLSSERAYLRAETLSCIRDDGGVIETKLDAYVVGEDGKAGVRGRLVSKQGQVIAKSLMAGFLGGVASAFDVNIVPSLNITPGNNTQFQSMMSGQMMQGAAMKGASNALDRIAQFYLDMAEGIFPVLEVDAGRQVDIILTRGVSLKIRS